MNDFFSEDPQFRRMQWTKVSDNVKEWQQEIAALISERLPQDLGLNVTVVFQKVDDEKGYAIGTGIARNEQTGTSIGIPIIVKAWHVAPFDIFFKDGQLFPLSKDNLAKSFFQAGIGAGVAPLKAPPNMADDAQAESRIPPLGGKYSYAAPLAMLDQLHNTLGAEDLVAFRQAVSSEPLLMMRFEKQGTFDRLCKWAAEKPKATQQDSDDKERALATLAVKKNGPDNYSAWASSDRVFEPILITADRQGLKDLLEMRKANFWDFEKDPFAAIDRYGEFSVSAADGPFGKPVEGPTGNGGPQAAYAAQLGPRTNPFVFDPLSDERVVKSCDVFGRYAVRDSGGVLIKGWVIPNVVTFDGGVAGTKLFIGQAMASIQNRIAGIPINDESRITLEPERPETGKIGTFVYRDGEKVVATVPFQVVGVTVYRDMKSVAVIDYKGNPANLIVSPTIDGIVPITAGKSQELGPLLGKGKNYFISAKMGFIRMPRLCPVSESAGDFKKIAAEHYLDAEPLKVSMANGLYVFRSPAIRKMAAAEAERAAQVARGAVEGPSKAQFFAAATAKPVKPKVKETVKVSFDYNGLKRLEAQFLLGAWGLGREKIAEVLDGVKSRIQLEVHHLRCQPGGVEKKASSSGLPVVKRIRSSVDWPTLLKVAGQLQDAESVDSVLSLGFVNPENIQRFAAAKPMLEEVASLLSKLLLAARLGMEDIPEEPVRSTLGQLERTIEGLSRLKVMGAYQEKTSSARASA